MEAELFKEEINVFLSYSHRDEESLVFVENLSKNLRYFVDAKSMFKLNIFVDRNKILWGDSWREKINIELNKASVFIPLLSVNYIRSENCRDEFFKFYKQAQDLKLTQLILPLIIVRAPTVFSDEASDELVQITRGIQWIDISEMLLEDSLSTTWKRTMNNVSDRFIESVEMAEVQLTELSAEAVESPDECELGEDEGLVEIAAQFEEKLNKMSGVIETVPPQFEKIQGVASQLELAANPNPKDVLVASVRLANYLKEPSKRIGEIGTDIFDRTTELDGLIASMKRIKVAYPEVWSQVNPGAMLDSIDEIRVAQQNILGMLTSLETLEMMSAVIRKSVRPLREGATKIADSIEMMLAWRKELS